jgi:putative iron-regulated protein
VQAEAVETYARIVHASYQDSLEAAELLDEAIAELVGDPSADTLEAARDAWLASREPYLQTEVYRFYDGPIDNPDDGPEGLVNAWPLDEAYIDYVEGDETAGLVNDTSVEIDAEALAALYEQGGEENIATGYHAIEFLLWGQDLDEDGPGDRPHTDYVTDGSGSQERRAEYLRTVSGMLVGHLDDLVAAWEPDASNYREEFESVESREALRRVLTGMIFLSGFETGGERLQTAYDSGDQEDEHSCFSDNTHRDMVQDVRGIRNVWRGSYQRLDESDVEGTGIRDVVRDVDADLATELDGLIEEALARAEALHAPFDQEIHPDNDAGRERVLGLIETLRDVEDLLSQVFEGLGLTRPVMDE